MHASTGIETFQFECLNTQERKINLKIFQNVEINLQFNGVQIENLAEKFIK